MASLYDEGENEINELDEEMNIINDEKECKKDVKNFTVKKSFFNFTK